jgi:dihydropteroate synthase
MAPTERADLLTAHDRPRVMGIVNVTPDSFSDGGRYLAPELAIAHGERLLDEGADILDIGGESTRPGATRPLVSEELDRVVPVITALAEAGATVSVDTMRAEVAVAAIAAGASIVNDVSGGLADPEMLAAVAGTDAAYVLMHWRGHADEMTALAAYDSVVDRVRAELAERLAAADAAGLVRDRIVLDPGLGFAKTADHNWALLAHLEEIESLGRPLLVGASRKSFLGRLLADRDGEPRPTDARQHADTAVVAHCASHGVWGVRVHDVRACRDALAVVTALARAHPREQEEEGSG